MIYNSFRLMKFLVIFIFCIQLFVIPDAFALSRYIETFTTKSPKKPPKKVEEKVDVEKLHIDIPEISSEIISLSPLDYEKIIREDEQNQMQKSKELRVGVHRSLEQISSENWRVFPKSNGKYSWRVVIHSPDAYSMRPHFKEFPPSDTEVYLYGDEGINTLRGPVKKPDVYEGKEFWGPVIKGEYLYIEIIQESPSTTPRLYIDKISHGYRDSVTGDYGDQFLKKNINLQEGSCHLDVTCYTEWNDTKTGVARISFEKDGSSYVCTGTLIMDTSSSFRNWFLTANHCISNNTLANTLQAYFNFRTDQCNGTAPNMWTLPSVNGATFKVGKTVSAGTDFSLLELAEDPPANVSYLGWNTDDLSAGAPVTGIHHPGGTYQRITFGNEDDIVETDGNWWDAKWWSGTTEGGSSGSPLFNSSRQIVGQLLGCLISFCPSCSNIGGHNMYGKFGVSWNDGLSVYLDSTVPIPTNGYTITSNLWIRAVINTVEKGPVEAVWKEGGGAMTARGDRVIWGHFYASPSDVSWGSENNPDLFVKIWFDVSGRVDVNYFHVSVPDIEVFSDYSYDGVADVGGNTTMDRRYIRHYYEGGNGYYEENYEDGVPASGYSQTGNPVGYNTINNLRIGSIINTVEKGPVEAIWRLGGQDTTARGDQVVWGHFYASSSDVTWGSENNPDLYVKIWFDVSGRIDVNYFHVSVPDIEVYSDYPNNSSYDQKGTTIMPDRYIRHEYFFDDTGILAKTELLKGEWLFWYTIISTFDHTYTLTTILPDKNYQGGYDIIGIDEWGDPVAAAYYPVDMWWALLDQSIIIDRFYVFYTDGVNILPNSCYYQITKSTGQFSSCYLLSGYKTASFPSPFEEDLMSSEEKTSAMMERETAALDEVEYAPVDESIEEKYWRMKQKK